MTRRTTWVGACFLAVFATGAYGAVEPAEPAAQQLVRDTTEKVVGALKSRRGGAEGDSTHLYRLVDELIIPHFDFSRMSKRVLGRHWLAATEQQRDRFVSEFQMLLVRTYATALNEYKDQTIDYLPLRARDDRQEVSVRTQVTQSGGPPIPITYEMYLVDQDWKVYDVSIDGVSLVINYRASFNSEIQRGGLDGLIGRLAEKNQSKPRE